MILSNRDRIYNSNNQIFFPEYRGRLTEGITYNPANNTLLWVDIIQGQVHRVNLADSDLAKSHEVVSFNDKVESIGAIALTKDDDVVLVCAKYGVAHASFKTRKIEYFYKYTHDTERLRSNDGIIDPWGNLWIGIMTDFPQGGVEAEGFLYRIDCKTLETKVMAEKCQISNGLAFSEDRTKFFWTDSLTFTVWQFDYDHDKVELSNKRPFIDTRKVFPEFSSPEPDGFAMNAKGHIFGSVFSTGQVVEYDANGGVVQKFKFPAERITCVALGGAEDNDIFVTTGHLHLDDANATIDASDKSGDLGGFLFRVKSDKPLHSKPKNIWGGRNF